MTMFVSFTGRTRRTTCTGFETCSKANVFDHMYSITTVWRILGNHRNTKQIWVTFLISFALDYSNCNFALVVLEFALCTVWTGFALSDVLAQDLSRVPLARTFGLLALFQ